MLDGGREEHVGAGNVRAKRGREAPFYCILQSCT